MSESDQLLREILEHGDLMGRARDGRLVIQLAVDRATFDRLMAFGGDEAECEDGGDAEPYLVPPVDACWLTAA